MFSFGIIGFIVLVGLIQVWLVDEAAAALTLAVLTFHCLFILILARCSHHVLTVRTVIPVPCFPVITGVGDSAPQKRKLLDMFTIGVSLAVAAIPEGLPIVVTGNVGGVLTHRTDIPLYSLLVAPALLVNRSFPHITRAVAMRRLHWCCCRSDAGAGSHAHGPSQRRRQEATRGGGPRLHDRRVRGQDRHADPQRDDSREGACRCHRLHHLHSARTHSVDDAVGVSALAHGGHTALHHSVVPWYVSCDNCCGLLLLLLLLLLWWWCVCARALARVCSQLFSLSQAGLLSFTGTGYDGASGHLLLGGAPVDSQRQPHIAHILEIGVLCNNADINGGKVR